MSKVVNERYLLLFFTRCPVCQKLFVSLTKGQLLQNVVNHIRSHKNVENPPLPLIEARMVEVLEGGDQ